MQSLQRETFTISREADYLSQRELVAQTGHGVADWAVAIVKELVDNGLDACESSGIAPEITIEFTHDCIRVGDNGPGLPFDVLERICDFSTRTSSNRHYVAPTRGAQGNALKTIIGIPFVLSGSDARGHVDVETAQYAIRLQLTVDLITERPTVELIELPQNVKFGTRVTVHWPAEACYMPETQEYEILHFADCVALCNPHATIVCNGAEWPATDPEWQKWRPDAPTSALWYTDEEFAALVRAHVANGIEKTAAQFVAEFEGLTSSAKQKRIRERADLPKGCTLQDIAGDADTLSRLALAMREQSKPVRADRLGVIGQDRFQACLDDAEWRTDSFRYKKLSGVDGTQPFVVEVAFVETDSAGREIIGGVNWSASIDGMPIQRVGVSTLSGLLYDQECHDSAPVRIAMHVATPRVNWTDRGKSRCNFDGDIGEALRKAIVSVTSAFARDSRRAQRQLRQAEKRAEEQERAEQWTLKDAVLAVLDDAIAAASNGGAVRFANRSVYYAVRPLIKDLCNKELTQSHFDTIRKEYEREHGVIPGLYMEPRGRVVEPHTGHQTELGTLAVENFRLEPHTCGSVLFVEKVGLIETILSSDILKRFDVLLVGSNGFSSDAGKALMSTVQQGHGLKVFCIHDADPYGQLIAMNLRKHGLRGEGVDIIDLGLTPEQAVSFGLEPETFLRRRKLPSALNGLMTDLQRTWWGGTPRSHRHRRVYECQRVELNALAADAATFIQWIEDGLRKHGCARKVIPPDDHLATVADDSLRQSLNGRVRDEIERHLDVDGMVGAAIEALADTVGSLDVDLAPWANNTPPELWTAEVDRQVTGHIGKHRETIRAEVDRVVRGHFAR